MVTKHTYTYCYPNFPLIVAGDLLHKYRLTIHKLIGIILLDTQLSKLTIVSKITNISCAPDRTRTCTT